LAPLATSVPQAGHARASALPHSTQNFAAATFSVPQLEQVTP